MIRALILGCGHRKHLQFFCRSDDPGEKAEIVTLDINPDVEPDKVHDLNILPYPFADNEFDRIEAIEVLEHFGQQGDFRAFCAQFQELWRILKPDGELRATCPMGMWVWGDPGHCREINQGTLVFLCQREYNRQQGLTPMSDYRWCYKGDFEIDFMRVSDDSFQFILKAVKPARR